MSGTESDPFPFTHGWSGEARHDAAERFDEALQVHEDLLPSSEAAAVTVLEILKADRVSITVVEGDNNLRDVVNVGRLQPDQVRFPVRRIYPMSDYPAATERLLAGLGYLSTSKSLDVVREIVAQSPHPIEGCFMGVPIVFGGEVLGELWALRGVDAPPFMPEDQDLVTDFATQFGSRLPQLLRRQRALYPMW